MKRVLIVRHAKSSWDDLRIQDIDRPLNDRGKKDAPEMAQRLIGRGIRIDAFISSPAKRARKTAGLFAEAYGAHKKDIVIDPSLYLPDVPDFYAVLQQLPEQLITIALFSHNPGITAFANDLTSVRVDNMPTCSVFAITCNTDHWKNFREAERDFWFFDYPKKTGAGENA